MEAIYSYLKIHKNKIIEEAENGDPLARRIMQVYELHRTCPSDLGAQGILQGMIAEHEKTRLKKDPVYLSLKADSESIQIYSASCSECGWFGMSDDCMYGKCPNCKSRVRREINQHD